MFRVTLFTMLPNPKELKMSIHLQNKLLIHTIEIHLKSILADSLGDAADGNPPANSGAQVWPLVWEDSTCRGVSKPMCLEPVPHSKRSHCNGSLVHRSEEEPLLTKTRGSLCGNEDPAQLKIKTAIATKTHSTNFPGGSGLRLHTSTAGGGVQSLVRQLGSHMLPGEAPKINKSILDRAQLQQ